MSDKSVAQAATTLPVKITYSETLDCFEAFAISSAIASVNKQDGRKGVFATLIKPSQDRAVDIGRAEGKSLNQVKSDLLVRLERLNAIAHEKNLGKFKLEAAQKLGTANACIEKF